jgi:glutaredoxin
VLPEVAAARAESGQPPQLFQLYEFEACPFCRRVREALTELDLSAEVYPCPKGSIRHREFVRSVGGREQFPYFLDPNTGVSMYESCTSCTPSNPLHFEKPTCPVPNLGQHHV